MPKINKKPTKKLPEGFRYQYRNFEGENEWEVMCPHGVGHRKGTHGCDGCCSKVWKSKINKRKVKEKPIFRTLVEPNTSMSNSWGVNFVITNLHYTPLIFEVYNVPQKRGKKLKK